MQLGTETRRSFDMSGFRQPITQEQAELMKELTGYNLALNPNTARLLQMGRTEGWSSTAMPVKKRRHVSCGNRQGNCKKCWRCISKPSR